MAYVDTQFEEPEIVKFAKLDLIGDSVEGIFAGTEERKNNFGKTEVQIKIKTGEAEDGSALVETLRANQRLLAQIAPVKRGAKIRIEYIDDRPNDGVDREGKPLKPTRLYRVQVDDGKSAEPASAKDAKRSSAKTSGTDDDIPF